MSAPASASRAASSAQTAAAAASVQSRCASRCACGNHSLGGQDCRDCTSAGARQQRKGGGGAAAQAVPDSVYGVLATPGLPLDAGTRAYFEPRFGHDFSEVRIHADRTAAESAQAVQAQAYTVGRHVVFDTGRFAPQTPDGRQLLAHELTHVLQQAATPAHSGPLRLDGGGPDERAAEEQAARVGSGLDAAMLPAPAGPARLARQPAKESRAQVDQRVLKRLNAIVRQHPEDGPAREQPLRELMASVPKEHARGLHARLEPGAKTDDFAQYFRQQFPKTRTAGLEALQQVDGGTRPPAKPALKPLADPKADPRYIDNAFKAGGIPILGGPVCFTEEAVFSAFRPHECIGRERIHSEIDPLHGQTLFELYDLQPDEKTARAAVAEWEKSATSPDIKVVAYYLGPNSHIYPTTISASTAPGVTGAAARGIQDERQYAAAASNTLLEAFLTFAGLRFPLKATGGAAPAAGAAVKTVATVEQALGAAKYAELAQAAQALRQASPKFAALTIDELVAIRAYTGEAWSGINSAARGFTKFTPEADALIKAMASGLKKLPAFTGRVVRSEARILKEAQAVYRQGATVVMDGFTSTSRAGAVAQREGNIAMTIEAIGKNGRDLGELSVHAGKEAEVLFPPGTRFYVDKVVGAGDALMVFLKEL